MADEKSCGAIVFAKIPELKFLLLQYDAGHWDFVKGNVEKNETERATAVRELREETGIASASFVEGFRERITYYYKRQGVTIFKEVVFFLMESQTDKITLSFEHVGYDWLEYQAALKRLTFRNAKNILRRAYEFIQKEGLLDSAKGS
jgi:bis(5'-nucleosidyl)-tetraphosphatase